MNNKTKIVLAAVACLVSGCVPLHVSNAKIDMESDAVAGTYNFVKASANCVDFCIDDCDEPKKSFDNWEWVKVPDGAEPPELILLEGDRVAFLPKAAGDYRLSVEVTCEDKGYEKTETASGSAEADFYIRDEKLLLMSAKILDDDEGKVLEGEQELIKKVYPKATTWLENDYNDDGINEILVYGNYYWVMISADKTQKMFGLTEKLAPNTSASIQSILGVKSYDDGKKEIFTSGQNSYGVVIVKFILDFANKTIERVSLSNTVKGTPLWLGAELYNTAGVNFLLNNLNNYGKSSCKMPIASLSDEDSVPAMIGNANICYDAKVVGLSDEGMVYKFGGKYFVYEAVQ